MADSAYVRKGTSFTRLSGGLLLSYVIVDVLSDGLEDVSTFRLTRERCWVGSLKVNVKQSRLKMIDDSLVNSFHDELIITVTEHRYHQS